jgi:single-stranded-DNA-specific exonuclease
MRAKWILPDALADDLVGELGEYGPIERQILAMRGLRSRVEVEDFMARHPASEHDPFQLNDMDKAVERILRARNSGDQIVIYGDYDVDGVTSVALMSGTLRDLGCGVASYIPDRFKDGYGLNLEAVRAIAEKGCSLLVTVDCGIRDAAQIEAANQLGMDVIVTDHHEPGVLRPNAVAVLNAKQIGDMYPFKSLAGVGIAYKLAQALEQEVGDFGASGQKELVALGTVADISPLRGENRRLVSSGLEELNNTERPGLKALLRVAKLELSEINAQTISFMLGPRLNAAGRMGSAETALRLLMATDEAEARHLADELESSNRRRQDLTRKTVERAIEIALDARSEAMLLFAADETFSHGVVGLAAARMKDVFYRPAFVAHRGKETTRGSARSVPGFHVTEALDQCEDILIRHGGHARAGGFTLRNEHVEEFSERLRAIAEEVLDPAALAPEIGIDAVVSLAQLGEPYLEFVDRLEPCGEGNPAPVLLARDVAVLHKRAVGAQGRHLKLTLMQEGRAIDAIAFRRGEQAGEIGGRVDVVFHCERNDYMGVRSLQMNVLDIRPAGEAR